MGMRATRCTTSSVHGNLGVGQIRPVRRFRLRVVLAGMWHQLLQLQGHVIRHPPLDALGDLAGIDTLLFKLLRKTDEQFLHARQLLLHGVQTAFEPRGLRALHVHSPSAGTFVYRHEQLVERGSRPFGDGNGHPRSGESRSTTRGLSPGSHASERRLPHPSPPYRAQMTESLSGAHGRPTAKPVPASPPGRTFATPAARSPRRRAVPAGRRRRGLRPDNRRRWHKHGSGNRRRTLPNSQVPQRPPSCGSRKSSNTSDRSHKSANDVWRRLPTTTGHIGARRHVAAWRDAAIILGPVPGQEPCA